MLQVEQFIEHLTEYGLVVTVLGGTDKQYLRQQWRAIFAVNAPLRPDQRRPKSCEWQVFATKAARAREGATALALYSQMRPTPFILLPEASTLPALRCTAAMLPDLSSLQLDLVVSPLDLSWTMVFTSEYPWHGPYFARREWQRITLPPQRKR